MSLLFGTKCLFVRGAIAAARSRMLDGSPDLRSCASLGSMRRLFHHSSGKLYLSFWEHTRDPQTLNYAFPHIERSFWAMG